MHCTSSCTDNPYLAAPGPKSINNESDAARSAEHSLPALQGLIPQHDGFLVACYSQHPLVPLLKAHDDVQGKPVDLGGYYHPSVEKTSKAMRPSTTFNEILRGI